MSPSTTRLHRCSPVALACVAALFLGACHGSDKKATTSSAVPATDSKGHPKVSLALKLGPLPLQVQAIGPAKPFDATASKQILKLVNDYINDGIATPLFTGSDAPNITRYFAPTLVSRIGPKGKDRAALTDEHAPVMTTVTNNDKQPLILVGFQDRGRLTMVGARFGFSVKGSTEQGPLTVSRFGNFVFEPDAKKVWHITGYTLVTRRSTAGASTTSKATTTTAAG